MTIYDNLIISAAYCCITSITVHCALNCALAEEADRLIIKFVGHQNAKRIRRALLFPELSIPGGYRLGERVYWCGSLSENVKPLHAKPADTFFSFFDVFALLIWISPSFDEDLDLARTLGEIYSRPSLSLFLSLSLYLFLSFSLSLFLSFSLSFFLPFFLSFSLSFFLPFFLSFFLSFSLSCSESLSQSSTISEAVLGP